MDPFLSERERRAEEARRRDFAALAADPVREVLTHAEQLALLRFCERAGQCGGGATIPAPQLAAMAVPPPEVGSDGVCRVRI